MNQDITTNTNSDIKTKWSTGWKIFCIIFIIFIIIVVILTILAYIYYFGYCKCDTKNNCSEDPGCNKNSTLYNAAFWMSIIGTFIIISPCLVVLSMGYRSNRAYSLKFA